MQRNAFAVGWICALAHELEASIANLDEEYGSIEEQDPRDMNIYTYGRIGNHSVVMACLPEGTYGTVSAAAVATSMQRSFPNLRFGLMVGIGGGIWTTENDVRLGDVVVSTPTQAYGAVIQYDLGKTRPGGQFERVGFLNKPPSFLFSAMANLRSKHNQTREYLSNAHAVVLSKTWDSHNDFSRPDASSDILYQSECQHTKSETCEQCGRHLQIQREARLDKSGKVDLHPEIHYGLIGSGNRVVANAEERDRLRIEAPILCVEMEAAGLMDSFPCLVIRGICDYADSYKHDEWQNYAAAMAATYARRLLELIPVVTVQDALTTRQMSSKFS